MGLKFHNNTAEYTGNGFEELFNFQKKSNKGTSNSSRAVYKCLSLTPNVTPHSSHPVHASSGKAENKIYSKPSPPPHSCKRSTNNINWNVPLIWHLWSGRKKSDQTSRNVKSFGGFPCCATWHWNWSNPWPGAVCMSKCQIQALS